jgi:putative transposase
MIIRKAFKYRLKTNQTEATLLSRYAGCCRFVWNKALALQKARLAAGERCLSYSNLAALLPEWKIEHPFLKDAPSQALQQTLMNLGKAINEAFDKKSPKRFPVFKKKGVHDSFRIPQGFEVNGQAVMIPKVGWIGYRNSQKVEGLPKNLMFSKEAGKWHVSVQVEIHLHKFPVHESTSVVGVDVGVTRFAALSDDGWIDPADSLRRSEKKLARLQRKLAKRKTFSKNWNKTKARIQNLHHHIANQRNDHLHKASCDISQNHAMVVMEDLKVKNMTASSKGTIEKPGRNVRQKAGLNKAILDQGWGEFQRQIGYKLDWQGGLLVLVNPAYTSHACSECGHVAKENRKTQVRFKCVKCGHVENADTNAAKNIKAAGLRRVSLWRDGAARPLNEAETCLKAAA